jgi:hypothetical protein
VLLTASLAPLDWDGDTSVFANTDQHGRTVATIAHHIRGDRAEYVVRLPQ